MPEFELLLSGPVLFWLTLLMAALLPLPQSYQPLTFYRFFAQKLAHKVNPDPNRSKQQLRLSGTLALLLAVVPFIIILAAFSWLMAWPEVYQLLLLYLCLDFGPVRHRISRLQQALQGRQLSLAKDLASHVLLRQTQPLSAVGLSKAGIESLWLQFAQIWLTTLFWYLIGGIWLAITIRLLLILQQEWSPKLEHNRHFGATTAILARYLLWPGYWLCFALVCIRLRCRSTLSHFRHSRTSYFDIAQRACLISACSSLRCRLGGPAMYSTTNKINRDKLAPEYPEPNHSHLLHALSAQQQLLHFMLAILLLFTAGWWLFTI